MDSKRICKKCLLRDQIEEMDLYQTIRNHIEQISVEERTETDLYEERLKLCSECEMLLSGMCRSCGCYVEIRAAHKQQNCPRKKW